MKTVQYSLVLERKETDGYLTMPRERLTFSMRLEDLRPVFAIGYLDHGDGSRNSLGDHMSRYLSVVVRAVMARVLGDTN